MRGAVEQRRRVFEVYLQELVCIIYTHQLQDCVFMASNAIYLPPQLCLQPRPVELNTFLDINQHIWVGVHV